MEDRLHKVPTLADRLPPNRARWADLRDSSTEDFAGSIPQAPCIDSQASYIQSMSQESLDGGSRADLHKHFASSMTVNTGADAAATSSAGPADVDAEQGKQRWEPNAAAPEFVPTLPGGVWPPGPRSSASSTAGEARQQTSVPGASGTFRHNGAPRRGPDEPNWRSSEAEPGATQSAGATTRRRITRKRGRTAAEAAFFAASASAIGPGLASGSTTPMGKRPRAEDDEASGTASAPPATEEDWQRRAEKRRLAVATIKTTAEYQAYDSRRDVIAMRRAADGTGMPAPVTPNPDDRSVSKRSWEAAVMKWRSALRHEAALAATDGTERLPQQVAAAD
eukprot:TRINITY_DN15989_c0_g1_i1.p1 TRINITY_DN15989_c0_g1~~TRINITY_DN15989_c0_g1_i1.p1  ORF type:complete len:336 (-),score=53.05 TRINITY_DN15989_c0_g1_i1:166-1173(-)